MKFRVKMLPTDDGYLQIYEDEGKCEPFLDEEEDNMDFSDLKGPTFISVFDQQHYQYYQQKYPEYLPEFDKYDKRFILLED